MSPRRIIDRAPLTHPAIPDLGELPCVRHAWYIKVGLRDARIRFVQALESGNYAHEARSDLEQKNWLAVGRVSSTRVVRMLHRCHGGQYGASPHHLVSNVTMHEFKPQYEGQTWYIKGYFIGQELRLFSVHPSGR